MIRISEDVMCPWCGGTSKLVEWNTLTYSQCTNDEMKDSFTPLMEEKAFKRETDVYYICPKCKMWSRGSQLKIVNTNDKKLLALGGDPIFTINE